MAAKVKAAWSGAPTAVDIHAKDGERILASAMEMLDAEPEESDLALGRRLLEGRDAERLAAALVKQLRAPLPAPEELAAAEARPAPQPRSMPAPTEAGEGVWFRMNVGRSMDADPRWILPFLCHRGHVTRDEIGRIRILDRETRFEVASYAAGRFATAAAKPGRDDAHIMIEASSAPGPSGPRAPHGAPHAAPRPAYAGAKRPSGPRTPRRA